MRKKIQIGFIPLLCIVGIIGVGIYMYLQLVKPSNPLSQSHDVQRKSDLITIQKALNAYYNDHNAYPSSDSSYQIVDRIPIIWGSQWVPYLLTIPKDPGSNSYAYISDDPNHQTYRLYASLENWQNEASTCNPKTDDKCQFAPDNACGGICNYAITSPNTSP